MVVVVVVVVVVEGTSPASLSAFVINI